MRKRDGGVSAQSRGYEWCGGGRVEKVFFLPFIHIPSPPKKPQAPPAQGGKDGVLKEHPGVRGETPEMDPREGIVLIFLVF